MSWRHLIAALSVLATFALPAQATATPLPNPLTVALAAAVSYAGDVCDGQVPGIEWDYPTPTDLPAYGSGAWVASAGNSCAPRPVIHFNAWVWHYGSPGWLAAQVWPQFCTAFIHEYLHFTSWNVNGQPEVNDPTSVEYDGVSGKYPISEPSQCGARGVQLWEWFAVGHHWHWFGNDNVPAYGEMLGAE